MKAAIAIVPVLGLLLAAAPAAAQQKVPVQFARGASSATLKGSIKGDQFRDYVVNARAGQTLSVTMQTSNAASYFNVLPPGSTGEAQFIGSTEGLSFSGPVKANGNTTIRVYLMRSAGRRGEVANYTLTVGVRGAAASTDALVPGTPYNATASIRCVAEPGKPMGACKAGVKRTGNGNGTVHISTPDGGGRVITFANGKAVSSDAGAAFVTERRGDTTVIRIGTAEVYEIPDAMILGG